MAEGRVMANAEQEVIKVRNPRSINPEKSVDVDISFDGEQFIPFAAMPDDTAGQSIYQEAIKGKYGEINISPGIEYYWSDDGWVEVVKPVAKIRTRLNVMNCPPPHCECAATGCR
jgi:hypothetical protein